MSTTEAAAPVVTPAATANRITRARRTRPVATGSSIEQAIALRDALLIAMRQANELARTLKQQRRQERIVANTLASLKALPKVAG